MSTSQQFCTFLVDGQVYGTPVARVQEVIRHAAMTQVPLAPHVVTGMINLRGQIVCAMDLRRRLQLPERAADQTPMSVVVRTNQGTVSLLVDEIGDVIEITEDALESPPETLQGVAREVVEGVYKLPDRLLLALDINRVVEVGERSKTEAENGGGAAHDSYRNQLFARLSR
jgi:purine-binding chemotaxis protein CheW